MTDIENHARGLLMRAQAKAEALLVEAQAQAEELRKQAVAAGTKDGLEKGMEQGRAEGRQSGHDAALEENRAELSRLVQALTAAAREIEASRSRLKSEAIDDVVHLAAIIARRVTKRQGLIDPAVLGANLNEAMKLVVHASDVRIAVHPSQRKALDAELPALQLAWPNLEHVELIGDPNLQPGGCRLFTRDGQIDGDLDTQIDRLVNELLPAKG